VARTANPTLLARLELMRCATRVAALEFEACTAYEALSIDTAHAEQAYARYLTGRALPQDATLLPVAHQPLLGPQGGSVVAIDDPQARLIAAAVLLRRGLATEQTVQAAVDTASARGWRRPLLAWLAVQRTRAQARGAPDDAARIQRRIDLLAH
jgi:hypothetical protein